SPARIAAGQDSEPIPAARPLASRASKKWVPFIDQPAASADRARARRAAPIGATAGRTEFRGPSARLGPRGYRPARERIPEKREQLALERVRRLRLVGELAPGQIQLALERV